MTNTDGNTVGIVQSPVAGNETVNVNEMETRENAVEPSPVAPNLVELAMQPPASSVQTTVEPSAPSGQNMMGVVERYVEGDNIVEVMEQRDGPPIAASTDAEYEARIQEDANTYDQDATVAPEGEVLEK